MQATPQQEHQWLERLLGEWTFENECSLGPDKPPSKFTGSESVRSLGGLWVLCEGRGNIEGELDPAGNVLTLDTEGPSCAAEGKLTKYKDVIEFKNDDHRLLISNLLGADGNWHAFMTGHYRRTK